MEKNKPEKEVGENEVFSSIKQLSKSESHIFRNVIIGILVAFLLGTGLIMIIATVFAEACATKLS